MTMAADAAAMLGQLAQWRQLGWLRALDWAFAAFLSAEAADAHPALLLAAALASHQLGRGHVCLELEAVLEQPEAALALPPADGVADPQAGVATPSALLAGLDLAGWRLAIAHPDLTGGGDGATPLVLDGNRLYLRRYWRYERLVETAIVQRLAFGHQLRAGLPVAEWRRQLAALFTDGADGADGAGQRTDWQKAACALAAASAFSIITGGPGTGKTTTVVKLLLLLQAMAAGQGRPPLRMCLAAPTGKAAARLKAAIADALARLPPTARPAGLRHAIPTDVTTLHRLLGARRDGRGFAHHSGHPLPADVLVVDEASMVDLEMMAAVLSALPTAARLLLLGDKDQLASVEAGSVLSGLCQRASGGHLRPDTVAWLADVADVAVDARFQDADGRDLDQHIIMLRHSHRFTAHSGIGRLAAAVNGGDPALIDAVWRHGHADLACHNLAGADDPALDLLLMGQDGAPGYAHYLGVIGGLRPRPAAPLAEFDAWAGQVLLAYGQFQLLCVLRQGPAGVAGLNLRAAAALAARGLVKGGGWYEGRPVLVTENDYRLGLLNGDIGIALNRPKPDGHGGQRQWALQVAFSDHGGGVRWLSPGRLKNVDTVFALTVHKSQGSEFGHCALVLPPKLNPALTRELVYTAITRAKQRFTLVNLGHPGLLNEAATRPLHRSGGLFAG